MVILNEESPQIKMKLKDIGEAYEWRVPEKLRQILDITYSVHSMRRHYRMDLYQTPILSETSVRRAMLIKEENQKVSLMILKIVILLWAGMLEGFQIQNMHILKF